MTFVKGWPLDFKVKMVGCFPAFRCTCGCCGKLHSFVFRLYICVKIASIFFTPLSRFPESHKSGVNKNKIWIWCARKMTRLFGQQSCRRLGLRVLTHGSDSRFRDKKFPVPGSHKQNALLIHCLRQRKEKKKKKHVTHKTRTMDGKLQSCTFSSNLENKTSFC